MITIDTIIINDIHELADWANSMYHNVVSYDNLNSIAIVAKYYEAKTLIETLIAERGFEISSIKELGDSNVNGYTDEYIITLFVGEIGCEPAKDNNGYEDICGEAVYVLENCNSKIMSHVYGENIFEVYIDNIKDTDDDYDGDCENCDCCGNDTYYFDVKSGTYEINGKKVSKKELLDYLGEKIDEMSEWNKSFSSILSEYEAIHNSIKRIYKLDDLLRF